MKKLSTRELVMVVGLVIGLVGYLFYEFIWVDLKLEQETILEEKNTLERTLNDKNVPLLEEEIENYESQIDDIELKVSEVKEKRTFGEVPYDKLITYMGQQADNLGVDLVNFSKMELKDKEIYTEVPYEVTVQGNYEDIILFVNSLYSLKNHFFTTAMEMQEVVRIPMTSETLEGDERLRNNIGFEWGEDFMNKLDEAIPAKIKKEAQEEFMRDFSNEMNEYQGVVDFDITNPNPLIHDKLQLKFVFHFVLVNE